MDVNGNFAPLYSLMQCLPDLTPTDCWECLKNISEMAMSRQGNQVLTVPCNLRYGMVQFYEGRPMWRIVIPSADAVVPPDHVMPTNQKHKSKQHNIFFPCRESSKYKFHKYYSLVLLLFKYMTFGAS
jgi:hypothetical protein